MKFNLVKQEVNSSFINTVSARDIHIELASKKDFSDWMKLRIKQGGFIADEDFTTIQGKSSGGRPTIEYYVSIDMAKHLGMMERNEQGKQIRQHFIDVENNTLPSQHKQSMLPAQVAEVSFSSLMNIARTANVPESFALQCISQEITRQSGIDLTKMLTQAKAMNDVPDEDIYLEPRDLGEIHGISGIKMNQLLAEWGLQYKEGSQWRPTAEGESISIKHGWMTKYKSGYNLKWKVSVIDELMETREVA